MGWTWDTNKDRSNRQSPGLSFETAILVFDDPFAATQEDPYPYEQRWRTLGVAGSVLLLVVHTWPELDPSIGEEVGRPISARKTTRNERRAYEERDSRIDG